MAGVTFQRTGEWEQASATLNSLSQNLAPAFKARVLEDGQMILDRMLQHIDAQDLPWTPLSDRTIELKNGDETIYVDSGYLRDNLEVKRLSFSSNGISIFIGASASKTTPKGENFADIMLYMECGTANMPARPLIQPTWEELETVIKSNWGDCLKEVIMSGR